MKEGLKYPFNFGIETEEILGRSGSVVKQRQLKEYKFELPLIVRNDYLSSDGIKTHDDVLNELVKFLITIIQSLYNLNHKNGIGTLILKDQSS